MTEQTESLLAAAEPDRVLDATIKRFLGAEYAHAGRSDEAAELLAESSLVLDELNQFVLSWIYRRPSRLLEAARGGHRRTRAGVSRPPRVLQRGG